MINTLFVEQISRQINFFAVFSDVSSLKTFDHVPANEKDQVSLIWRYSTNLGDFRHRRTDYTQGIYKRTWKGAKIAESKLTQQRVNEFFTNLPPKTWTPVQYNDLLQA